MNRYRNWIVYGVVALLVAADFIILPRLMKPNSFSERKDTYQIAATIAAGIAVLSQFIVASLNLAATERNIELSRATALEKADIDREGQITERFTKAVDQLGNETLAIRLGGIYALERIAKDSPKDHKTIMEVLTAFIRGHAFSTMRAETEYQRLSRAIADPMLPMEQRLFLEQERHNLLITRADTGAAIKAALDVLGRRIRARDDPDYHLNLSHVVLVNFGFGNWHHFERAIFSGCTMRETQFLSTHLEESFWGLGDAHLEGTEMVAAHLERAKFLSAHIEWARLTQCHFDSTDFTSAFLDHARIGTLSADYPKTSLMNSLFRSTWLRETHFIGANADGADFTGATFFATTLENVDFRQARGLTQDQINNCIFRGEVLLPEGLHPPGQPPGILSSHKS